VIGEPHSVLAVKQPASDWRSKWYICTTLQGLDRLYGVPHIFLRRARRYITRLRSTNGGIAKVERASIGRRLSSCSPRREEAVVAFQRLARTKVFNTGVAVSPKPLTNDVREAGGSVWRIQRGRRRSNRRRAFEAALPPLARAN